MAKITTVLFLLLLTSPLFATIHKMYVWDGYFRFVDESFSSSHITVQLGDTIDWLPLDQPAMVHTITSTSIPNGAASFDQIWQAPADTFFRYIPSEIGTYQYVCTPHATSHNMTGSFEVVDGATSVPDLFDSGYSVFPNPATRTIYFSQTDKTVLYNIFNIKGQLMQTGAAKTEINVGKLKKGSYILELKGVEPRTQRFEKR